jgi:predicted ribosomally synthesized peptide with nif11-like leader
MSTENITKFSDAVTASPELQAKVQSIHVEATRAIAEKIAALSAEVGAPFTAEEFLTSAQTAGEELSEEQLDEVAGGTWRPSAGNIAVSIFTLGLVCGLVATVSDGHKGHSDGCQPDEFRM